MLRVRDLEKIESGTTTHADLWKDFLKGEVEAYEQLFKAYYSDLYGYGLKLSKRPELVKDTIQELFVKLWERRERLSEVDSIKGYLLVSLRRMLLRKLKNDSLTTLMDDKQKENLENLQFSAEEIVINKEIEYEQKRELLEALELLPDRQKEVLFLRYYNGMNYEEIQQILSINYQSVRNHVYRATSKLKDILEERLYKIVI